jgi:hypothetical protein
MTANVEEDKMPGSLTVVALSLCWILLCVADKNQARMGSPRKRG